MGGGSGEDERKRLSVKNEEKMEEIPVRSSRRSGSCLVMCSGTSPPAGKRMV